MKKTKILFAIWAVIVLVIVVLLTILGFKLGSIDKEYEEVENKLLDSTKRYVDTKFLYPEGKDVLVVTSEELKENDMLDDLKKDNDTCKGYVEVRLDGVYKYKVYIKCKEYTTKGYKEK